MAIVVYVVVVYMYPWMEATEDDELYRGYLDDVDNGRVAMTMPWVVMHPQLRDGLLRMLHVDDWMRPPMSYVTNVLKGPWVPIADGAAEDMPRGFTDNGLLRDAGVGAPVGLRPTRSS